MRRPRAGWLIVASCPLLIGALLLGWITRPTASLGDRGYVAATTVAVAGGEREAALQLYAAGQFPGACERFSRAAADDPQSPVWRQDVARCFEGWGRDVLRQSRPDEALLLFRQGLKALPDDPALLKAAGIASIHGGRSTEALEPLERAVAAEDDAEVRLLLARLYDQRDRTDRALIHLAKLLAREPEHPAARRLLDKIERERRVEAGFQRETTERFVVKHRATSGETVRPVLQALDRAWERVGDQLDYHPAERVTVVLYEGVQFHDVTRVHGWVTGLYDGKIRLPLGSGLPAGVGLERLVLHEYAHAAIHELSRGRAPRWLQEGLAQYLEGVRADPLLRGPGGLTLAGLEALIGDPDPTRARVGYDIALWVTEDLLSRGGVVTLRTVLVRLGHGDTIAAAMTKVYGMRLAELESQWRNLLGG